MGNIPYDACDQEIANVISMSGPFNQFRLKMDRQTTLPKGYGFAEYRDKDIASAALRNLNKHELLKRELKVDFASDNKNGSNLRPEDILNRDLASEMFKKTFTLNPDLPSQSSFLNGQAMLQLPLKVQIVIIYSLKELIENLQKKGDADSVDKL